MSRIYKLIYNSKANLKMDNEFGQIFSQEDIQMTAKIHEKMFNILY
jgi:hypothetical protein